MKIWEKYYKIILTAFFALFILIVFYNLFSNLSFPKDSLNYTKDNTTKLYSEKSVFQVFRATRDNLNQISVDIKNASSIGWRDAIAVQLLDESCGELIAQKNITKTSQFLGAEKRFKFSPIQDSAGKNYCLKITHFRKGNATGNWPYISASSNPQFADASYTNTGKGGQFKGRSLVIKPAYTNENLLGNLKELSQRMSQYKPWFFKGGYMSLIFILSIVTIVSLTVLLISI